MKYIIRSMIIVIASIFCGQISHTMTPIGMPALANTAEIQVSNQSEKIISFTRTEPTIGKEVQNTILLLPYNESEFVTLYSSTSKLNSLYTPAGVFEVRVNQNKPEAILNQLNAKQSSGTWWIEAQLIQSLPIKPGRKVIVLVNPNGSVKLIEK